MNVLEQLSGLILPEKIKWWPLAPGWYVLLLIVCAVTFLYLYHRRKEYLKNAYRRDAILKLSSESDASQLLSILYHVLTQALSQPVELEKQAFLDALNNGHKHLIFDEQDWLLLSQLSFQHPSQIKEHASTQGESLLRIKIKCAQWIKEHHYEY
jgi:uncharacterized protein (DUF2249 family)